MTSYLSLGLARNREDYCHSSGDDRTGVLMKEYPSQKNTSDQKEKIRKLNVS